MRKRLATLRTLRSLRGNRRGGILSVTMISLPLLLAMSALVVDLGILYVAKSSSESAALYAAESAALRLPDAAAAEDVAQRVALLHLSGAGYARDRQVDITASASQVTVSVNLDVRTFFAEFAGLDVLETSSTITRQ